MGKHFSHYSASMRPLFLSFTPWFCLEWRFDAVRIKTVLFCCLSILIVFVVFSVCRIEYLNATGGHVLPRHETTQSRPGQWEIADLDVVLNRLDDQFFERRGFAGRIEASENGESVPANPNYGAPYSAAEQRSIASVSQQHDVLSKLHWNVRTIGLPQYFLAPVALILAAICGLGFKGIGTKVFATVCAGLSCLSIFLVLVRGYWNAL